MDEHADAQPSPRPVGPHGPASFQGPVQRRVVRLRRPPALSVAAERFVPVGRVMDEVDERWAIIRDANPAAYDGSCYHVVGVHRNGHGGAVIHVLECAYRYHAVQSAEFDVGMRGLGVKGIVERDGRLLAGRRSEWVSSYRGLWELAPGGAVEPGEGPGTTIVKELTEETGLVAPHPPTPIALLYDPDVRTWEIVFRFGAVEGEAVPTHEYPEVGWFEPDAMPEDATPLTRRLLPMARATIRMSPDR